MLKQYADYIEKKKIPYFWNKKLNLINDIDDSTLLNYKYSLNKIIKEIETKYESNPEIITEYICKY